MSDVLIVDDGSIERARCLALLREHGYHVREARGGEALSVAIEFRPLTIVIDSRITEPECLAVCRALRADRMAGDIPMLILLTREKSYGIGECLGAGADDVVIEDDSPELLLARIDRLIRYRRMATTTILNEQLAQVGRLLAGIIHEIRGPLGVIRGNAELMRLQLSEGDPALQYADPIIRSAQVLQVRLEHLMSTVRSGKAILAPTEIGPLVREAADYFRKGSDPRQNRVNLIVAIDEGLPHVGADAGRLIQVLLNLLANAREALSIRASGGEIKISARLSTEPNGNRLGLAIEVTDNGPGIPEEIVGRIFEPFYTTKETGTGYGLYLSREILREHQGHLIAENGPGGGARFLSWIPIHEQNR
jgi:two-component system, sensor histidine kinase and response regulator